MCDLISSRAEGEAGSHRPKHPLEAGAIVAGPNSSPRQEEVPYTRLSLPLPPRCTTESRKKREEELGRKRRRRDKRLLHRHSPGFDKEGSNALVEDRLSLRKRDRGSPETEANHIKIKTQQFTLPRLALVEGTGGAWTGWTDLINTLVALDLQ